MQNETKRPNTLEIELACEMLSDMLQSREDINGAVLTEHDRERRYELAFDGIGRVWNELQEQYGDRLAPVMAQMTMAREHELRTRVQQRERLERGR
ncbi:MAG TPA: hypothetical protein VFN57_01600 [Thermomicrobiaceae bacterium]|nr:hypothetical protein [Thermomicrobiaceae bacterium]